MGCLPLNSEDDHAAPTATDIGLVVSIWSHRREKTLAGLGWVMTRLGGTKQAAEVRDRVAS